MIKERYNENIKALQAIINQKQTIQKVLYNIKHDKNIEFYMEELLYFASSPDEISKKQQERITLDRILKMCLLFLSYCKVLCLVVNI